MLKKYNIALVPKSKTEEIVNVSEKFLEIADQYKLGDESLPHVTLCQFQADEKKINKIWDQVCEALSEHMLELEFKDFSCITFNNIIFWVSLMPDQRSALDRMHRLVANIVNVPVNKHYDPHMTLISTKDAQYKEKAHEILKSYSTISDKFVISLGECDSVGQFTKLLYQSTEVSRIRCKI